MAAGKQNNFAPSNSSQGMSGYRKGEFFINTTDIRNFF